MGYISEYLADLGPLQIIGCGGFFLYIGVFALVQCGRMDGNSLAYSVGNLLAAFLVGLSLLAEFNLSSALIQTSFFIVAMVGIAKRLGRRPQRQSRPRAGQEIA